MCLRVTAISHCSASMVKVAVIGGGPTGFAAARALMHEPHPFEIHIYEKQALPGGVWVYTGMGPIYRDLNSNIHKRLMEYNGREFGPQIPQFVDRRDVLTYIEHYSRDIESHHAVTVHWATGVDQITKQGDVWKVELDNGAVTDYDFVLVATGHYHTPYVPNIPGLRELQRAHPGKLVHTKRYVVPEPFRGKKVLLIGNSASGVDVAIQILSVTTNLTISRRTSSPTDVLFDDVPEEVHWKPECEKIDPETEVVTFKDGTTDKFDLILLATGYVYRMPFLVEYNNEAELPLLDMPSEQRVCNLHKFMFYIGDTSLAFVGLNKNISPLPFSECQGAVIARVWSQRLRLPSKQEMIEEEAKLVAEKPGSEYFAMGYPVDVEYMRALNDWADQSGNEGFFAERWNDEKAELRKQTSHAKIGEFREKLRTSIAGRKLRERR